MNMPATLVRLLVIVALLALSACRSTPPVSEVPVPQPEAEGPGLVERIARVRQQAGVEEHLEVTPWRDPQVEDFRTTAREREAVGNFPAAARAIEIALEQVPGDPELLQWLAELLFLQGRLEEAIVQAGRSFEIGPRIGSLCRRNWGLLREAYLELDYPDGVAIAEQRYPQCSSPVPVRM